MYDLKLRVLIRGLLLYVPVLDTTRAAIFAQRDDGLFIQSISF